MILPNSLVDLTIRAERWGYDRGILSGQGDLKTQMLKCVAEVGELADEVAKGGDVRMELGDVLVTLIMVSKLADTEVTACLRLAVEKIEKRSGEMRNGTYVKDGD